MPTITTVSDRSRNVPYYCLMFMVFILTNCNKDDETNCLDLKILNSIIPNNVILDTAQANLQKFIRLIEIDNINHYGFNNLNELDSIILGEPYLELELTDKFIIDNTFNNINDYVIKSNNWRVPLMINDIIRCYMIIYLHNDTLSFSGGGGSEFAKRHENCLQKYRLKALNTKYLLTYREYNCRFIMIENNCNYQIYPIGDSIGFGCFNSYEAFNNFEDFFYSFK